MQNQRAGIDQDSEAILDLMSQKEKTISQKIPSVRTVLVVLSSKGMVFDIESIRQKIHLAYADAAIFFQTTRGQSIGTVCPRQIDLLIDFTGPGQRQGLFYSRKLRRMARFAVGRNAGLFRRRIYDRVFDEKDSAVLSSLPSEALTRERVVQKAVLALAGVTFVQAGDALPDRAYSIALELPAMRET